MAKKIQKVVVTRVYLDLLQRKAGLAEEVFEYTGGYGCVSVEMIKEYEKIAKAWDRLDHGAFEDAEVPVADDDDAPRGPQLPPEPKPKPMRRGKRKK